MIDYKPTLFSQLSSILPNVYPDHKFNSDCGLPCITYRESGNTSEKEGDTLRYSSVRFKIKIWAETDKEIMEYSKQIDELMRSLGFTRIGTAEL